MTPRFVPLAFERLSLEESRARVTALRDLLRRRRSVRDIAPDPVPADLIDAALAASPRFGLKAAEANAILRGVFAAVSNWRKTARQLRLGAGTLDAYATAFEHPLMAEAQHLS